MNLKKTLNFRELLVRIKWKQVYEEKVGQK